MTGEEERGVEGAEEAGVEGEEEEGVHGDEEKGVEGVEEEDAGAAVGTTGSALDGAGEGDLEGVELARIGCEGELWIVGFFTRTFGCWGLPDVKTGIEGEDKDPKEDKGWGDDGVEEVPKFGFLGCFGVTKSEVAELALRVDLPEVPIDSFRWCDVAEEEGVGDAVENFGFTEGFDADKLTTFWEFMFEVGDFCAGCKGEVCEFCVGFVGALPFRAPLMLGLTVPELFDLIIVEVAGE